MLRDGTRFVVVRYLPDGSADREPGSCRTLEDALGVLMPCHVERGWKVREEFAGEGKTRVVQIFDVEVVDGEVVVSSSSKRRAA